VYDILVRLKALASQAGSSQLSSTERGMLDTEYQAMVDEIDRLAANTTFNNNAIINANMSYSITGAGASSGYFGGANSSNWLDIAFGGQTFANTANSGVVEFSIGANSNASGGFSVSATANGVTLTGSLGANLVNGNSLISGTAIRLTTGQSGDNTYVSLTLNAGAEVATGGRGTVSVGQSSTSTFAFKVGTSGISANDEISLKVRGMNTKSLGINQSNITTVQRSDAASAAVTEAINILLNARSEVGAVQNRLESAQNNINTILENIEAARSAYLDLDIAAEMATFTSKQILVQAGVSMLAEANKVPQNLLRLFQG